MCMLYSFPASAIPNCITCYFVSANLLYFYWLLIFCTILFITSEVFLCSFYIIICLFSIHAYESCIHIGDGDVHSQYVSQSHHHLKSA